MKRSYGRARRTTDAPAAIGQRIEVVLDRLSHDGRGIGRWQGRTTFVEGGLPGERVTGRVIRARSKLIEARIDQLLESSPERQAPRCQHADICGGCTLQHIAHHTQIELKQQALAQQLQHFAGITPERWMSPLRGPAYGYRQRTRLSVRWDQRTGRLQTGYRQSASNELVEIRECPILIPVLEALVKELPEVLQQLKACTGLGHVELIGGDAPAMVVRHIRPLAETDVALLEQLASRHDVDLWLQGETDAIRCAEEGAAASELAYQLDDQNLRFTFAPGDFTQVNAVMNQKMVNQAMDWLDAEAGQKVLDLFCGVGNFALPLAQRGAEVTGVEGDARMVERAILNAQNNRLDGVHFCQADLSKPFTNETLDQQYQAALLDPPRDGAEALVAALAERGIGRILYVSCNPATLARDAGILASKGYRLVQAGVMDMFPQTAHVEAMALFVSGKEKNRNGTSQS
ncbi:23S rRNA (uracil(1939)-C(5))-methyltransferase RlmD [Pseudomonas sp. OIL-1]|uniref:23S rRNA (uracil(1939)-C(5))-methyltransferase RlmD n=1 Tax=Pseudomonas sp. OIL-1 TaxID=2706126 RepID=UPI0013A719CA|nr:23S rRNA (uracil(1939)-C(5))-methyltransferase RlmD [Pseudomonas sp. OIL-1]QIB51121.1 23S rRNA (uracil(1939)-C(5))-methyltransferase RlmD [Pseudomonas sp. OIL-1]